MSNGAQVQSAVAQPTDEELEALKQCPQYNNRDVIYFGNGVGTGAVETLAQANINKNELIKRYSAFLKDQYPDDPFQFCLAYNASRETRNDLLEVLNQKAIETGGLTTSQVLDAIKLKKDTAQQFLEIINTVYGGIVGSIAISAIDVTSDVIIEELRNDANSSVVLDGQKATTDLHVNKYRSDLCIGNRVIVVAHSQGNLFANEAVDQIVNKYPDFEHNIGIVGVANPANRVGGNNEYINNFDIALWKDAYITAEDDRVINTLRGLQPNVLESNIDNDLFFSPIRDLLNHAFIDSYFTIGLPSLTKIDLMLNRLLVSIDDPSFSTIPEGCDNIGVTSVTIKDKDTNTIIPGVKVTASHPLFGYFTGITDQDGKYTVTLPLNLVSPDLNLYQFSINASGYTPVLGTTQSFLDSGSQCTVIAGSINCFISNNYPNNVTLLLEKSAEEFATIEVKRVEITGEVLPSAISTMAQVDDSEQRPQNSAYFNNVVVSTNSHSAKVTDLPQYKEKVAVCSEPDCTLIPGDSGVIYEAAACNGSICEKQVEVQSGQLTRAVFLYEECASGYIKEENGIDCISPPPSSPPELYKKRSSLCIDTSPALAANGKFYGTAQPDCSTAIGRGVVEIEPNTGTINWGPTIAAGCSSTGGPGVSVGSSGLVYAIGDWNACGRGNLIAVRQLDGGIAWDHGDCPGPSGNTSPHPRQTPAIDESLGSIYFGSSQLCSVDMNTGVNNWKRSGGRYIGEDGIVIDSAGNVSYGTLDRSLNNTIRSYTSTGTFKWERIVGRRGSVIGAVTANDSLLINFRPESSSQPNAIHEVSTFGNTSIWPISGIRRPVLGSSGEIYASIAGTSDVVSVDESTKTENWRVTLPSSGDVLVDFVTAEGLIIARSGSALYALNTTDGSVAWQYAADSLIHIAARLTATGDIFFTDDLSNVYLLDTNLNYAASIWPIAEYGDERHSQKVGP